MEAKESSQYFKVSIPEVRKEATLLCARRGSQWLSAEDLSAHLAALLRLENVGVLLGAGASMGSGLGGMTMKSLWERFLSDFSTSYQWLVDEHFIAGDGSTPNVEALADSLEIARLEWTRQGRSRKLVGLSQARADLQRVVIRAAVLDEQLWEDPTKADLRLDSLHYHRSLLHKLAAARQPGQPSPWLFTTNYDLAIEWAGESIGLKLVNGFDGLHNRSFAPHNFDLGFRNMLARGEARFGTYSVSLVKLHGSLTWQVSKDDYSYVEHSTSYLWPRIKAFLDGATPHDFPGPLVFPSAAKYMQTVGFVHSELLRRFTDILSRSQACLITCGYSFSDEHINRIIATALQNPTLQLVIYLPEAIRDGDSLVVESCRPWVQRILKLASPQVTVIGGGETAYFASLVQHLPDPAIFDEQAAKIREMLREYRRDGYDFAASGAEE